MWQQCLVAQLSPHAAIPVPPVNSKLQETMVPPDDFASHPTGIKYQAPSSVAVSTQPPHRSSRPQYSLQIDLHPDQRFIDVQQRVQWTNPGTVATSELVFQVTANNKLTPEMIALGERTVESLRLNPAHSIDYEGRRFHLQSATVDGNAVESRFDSEHDTHLHVTLPNQVGPGQSVTLDMRFRIQIPKVMGRLGQYKGITNLLNWYPVLAVYSDGWQPVPYIPWHQPWFNEAGDYQVTLTAPADHTLVTGGHVVRRSQTDASRQTLEIQGAGLRDFTIVASRRLRVLEGSAEGTPIRVYYFAEHKDHAETVLTTAVDSVQTYTRWFGKYPYRELEITESYFGWNGNESSGVVMIDERIFDLPKYASRYIEHLASHEICHQWWYSAVGTNGYAEPWMDEGLVTWFTRVRMEDRYGKDSDVLDFPSWGPFLLPNVPYRSLVHSGYDSYRRKGGNGSALGTLDEIGHLHNLFSLVYDKGARITGIIQKQMGREAFFDFLGQVYRKYRFKILTINDFQSELEAYTQRSWAAEFQAWKAGGKDTDLRLQDVEVTETETGYRTQAVVSGNSRTPQKIDLGIQLADDSGSTFRMATISEANNLPEGVSAKQISETDWLVTIESDSKPDQLVVDPEGTYIDGNPYDNAWGTDVDVRLSPLYTPVDEASLTQPWQRHSVVTGFGVDQNGRIGFRASAISSNRFRISPFISYTAATATRNNDRFSAGVDAVFYNFPNPNWQLIARYEQALLTNLENDPGQQGRIALRRIINYTSSLIYPDLAYVDVYARFGDNFFPDEDNTNNPDPRIEEFDDVRAFGVDFHLDSQKPYWDPDRGIRIDANYEHGFRAFGGGATYNRVSGQFAAVQRLNHTTGWLSRTKVAGRVSGGYGWDDNGEHFRFGGPGRFRGRSADQTEGNAFWLGSLEWRFPIVGDLNYDVLDNTASLKGVDGSIFYDVGRSYLLNEAQGKADHAVGVGLYWQIPILSFVENLTVRTEYGYSVTNETGNFWFGLYRAF